MSDNQKDSKSTASNPQDAPPSLLGLFYVGGVLEWGTVLALAGLSFWLLACVPHQKLHEGHGLGIVFSISIWLFAYIGAAESLPLATLRRQHLRYHSVRWPLTYVLLLSPSEFAVLLAFWIEPLVVLVAWLYYMAVPVLLEELADYAVAVKVKSE